MPTTRAARRADGVLAEPLSTGSGNTGAAKRKLAAPKAGSPPSPFRLKVEHVFEKIKQRIADGSDTKAPAPLRKPDGSINIKNLMRINARHPAASPQDTFLYPHSYEIRQYDVMAPRLFLGDTGKKLGHVYQHALQAPLPKVEYAFVFGKIQRVVPAGHDFTDASSSTQLTVEEMERQKAEHDERIQVWHHNTMGEDIHSKVKAGAFIPGTSAYQELHKPKSRTPVRKLVKKPQPVRLPVAPRTRGSPRHTLVVATSVVGENAPLATEPSAPSTTTITPRAQLPRKTPRLILHPPRVPASSPITTSGLSRKRKVATEDTAEEPRIGKKLRVGSLQSSDGSQQEPQYSSGRNATARLSSSPSAAFVGRNANKRKLAAAGESQEASQQPSKRRRVAAEAAEASTSVSGRKSLLVKLPVAVPPSSASSNSASSSSVEPSSSPTPNTSPAGSDAASPIPITQHSGTRNGFQLISEIANFVVGKDQTEMLRIQYYANDENGQRARYEHVYGFKDGKDLSEIDWNDRKVIHNLNKWYKQWLRRWDFPRFRDNMNDRKYSEVEIEWIREYERAHKDDKPPPTMSQLMEAFNAEFVGKEIPITNKDGEPAKTAPRAARTREALMSFIDRENLCPVLKPKKRKSPQKKEKEEGIVKGAGGKKRKGRSQGGSALKKRKV